MNCLFQFVAELLLGEYVMKRVFFGAVHRWRRRWRAHDYQQFLFRRMIDHENKNLIPFLFRLRQGGGAFSRSGAHRPAARAACVCGRALLYCSLFSSLMLLLSFVLFCGFFRVPRTITTCRVGRHTATHQLNRVRKFGGGDEEFQSCFVTNYTNFVLVVEIIFHL